jgi:pSer/pThr/pTyr-binding forkhead associated (FHA) protein
MGFKFCEEGHIMDPSWKKCPVCIAPLSGWLVEFIEKRPGKVYTIHEGKSCIGSGADCEIRILDRKLARQHAFLTIIDSTCSIVDPGNSTSIQVNNADTVKATLIDGDIIKLGETSFKIKLL